MKGVDFTEMPVLENAFVRLEPLSLAHADDLAEAVADGDVYDAWFALTPSPEEMRDGIAQRLAQRESGVKLPYAVIDPRTGRAIGMTGYLNPNTANRRIEVGGTWYARSAQKTAINPSAKLLLLGRAFEDLGCMAVEFRTHWFNRQSRAAIERLGAKQDGVLRNHVLMANGTVRDTVVYSIIESEWSTVKFALQDRIRRYEQKLNGQR